MVDRAVGVYGRYVEHKLDERDKQGKPMFTLEDILEGRAQIGARSGVISLTALALAQGRSTLVM